LESEKYAEIAAGFTSVREDWRVNPLPRELMCIHTLHLVAGLASLAFFAATAAYLRLHAPPLAALELGLHM
jgi:hypothetical protein